MDYEKKHTADVPGSGLLIQVKNVERTADEGLNVFKRMLDKVKELRTSLNVTRSCMLRFTNHTSRDLQLLSSQHIQGGFSVIPSAVLKAGTTVEFSSESKPWLIGTGTKGKITYINEDLEITLDWNNPFFKSNSSGVSLNGASAHKFSVVPTTGAGCKQALMCYDLFEISE